MTWRAEHVKTQTLTRRITTYSTAMGADGYLLRQNKTTNHFNLRPHATMWYAFVAPVSAASGACHGHANADFFQNACAFF